MSHGQVESEVDDKVRCDACPVMCYIRPGMAGACDRYANRDGKLVRVDPHVLLERTVERGGSVVPFSRGATEWAGAVLPDDSVFVTAIGAGTTYPDYKPAPFIVSSEVDGVDMVTVVTEGIFSYCGVKVKIDTDRYLGPEQATVRVEGEAVGHVTTGEYGSQMLSLGGVHHLTGGSKKEGRVTCDALAAPLQRRSRSSSPSTAASRSSSRPARRPIINGAARGADARRLRLGDDRHVRQAMARPRRRGGGGRRPHHRRAVGAPGRQAARHPADRHQDEGPALDARPLFPGRRARHGLGRHEHLRSAVDPRPLRPEGGAAGPDHADGLDHRRALRLLPARRGAAARRSATCRRPCALSVERIQENCEPALSTVLFMGGAGGSLRAGVTENPVRLTRSVKDALTRVTCGGAPAYVWPGGGITFMVDVTRLPANAFGYVPTPALVAPIEFTMRLSDYAALGGHMDHVRPLSALDGRRDARHVRQIDGNPWPVEPPDAAEGLTA